MRIAIVAVEGSLLSAIAGLSDLFWITNQALRAPPEGMEQGVAIPSGLTFETRIVSADGQPLRDPQGRLIPVDEGFAVAKEYDVVLVTGMALGADGLPPMSESIQQAAHWL
ncbi:type 1 glutamine amidotransferase family protein [Undibacterium aquatile]|uniref:hypothetical protein n=1 Tax=Undibacterium aquatile TaxID=1537398 RepID=UPI001CC26853|nr:hypothetical protein [Undibacterium aquatile]